jgi:excisionase family DNA binding protein
VPKYRLRSIEEQLRDYPDFLTPDQVREILQISERTLYRLLRGARLEAVKVGGVWRIPKVALIEYLQERNCLNID